MTRAGRVLATGRRWWWLAVPVAAVLLYIVLTRVVVGRLVDPDRVQICDRTYERSRGSASFDSTKPLKKVDTTWWGEDFYADSAAWADGHCNGFTPTVLFTKGDDRIVDWALMGGP